MLGAAARALEANQEAINALNVFPVPDGDTGTNMLLTMRSVLDGARTGFPDHAGDAARIVARAALLGARGNSGLILAQFFKGISGALEGSPVMGTGQFARALQIATDNAYASVPDPREGTMLTVFRECARRAYEAAQSGASLDEALAATVEQAHATVAKTPSMLDVLREAGVVDSGGYGFAVMLQGAHEALTGQGTGAHVIAAPVPDTGGAPTGRVRPEFTTSALEVNWGYCTVFAIEGSGLDPAGIRQEMASMGKSAVVAGDSEAVKVHVHVLDPGKPISYGVGLGTVSNVEVKNMDEQARGWAAARKAEDAPAVLKLAVVAVVAGAGMQALFQSTGLGACSVVAGGDSMNPSTQELLAAVERAPSENVVVLPNNKNVIGTARLLQGLTRKHVHVVPTRSMPAGLAALLGFSPDGAASEVAAAMKQSAAGVREGSVFRASRTTSVDGRPVAKGEYLGMLDEKVVSAGRSAGEALAKMLQGRVQDGAVVTLYRGARLPAGKAEAAVTPLRKRHKGAEVELLDGGQPHHEYLVSIE